MAHATNLDSDTLALPAGSGRHWAARVSRVFARLVEIPAAVLVVAEIIVLLAGMLFLWLAMLGSVIAFQRGEHMRMTAIVGMLGPRARAFLDVVAVAAALAFLVLIVHRS